MTLQEAKAGVEMARLHMKRLKAVPRKMRGPDFTEVLRAAMEEFDWWVKRERLLEG